MERIVTPDLHNADRVVLWMGDEDLQPVATSAFWNDEEIEHEKAYNIQDGRPEKLWRYLRDETTFHDQCEAVVNFARDLGLKIQGTGIDVAAGVCWTTALLSKNEGVDTVYAIDISKHRLFKLAPLVIKEFGGKSNKIIRVFGSFYDIRLPDSSVDFCMMCQAFHHADDPWRLLRELHRVLKPWAPVLVIGENPIYPIQLLKKRMKNIIKMLLPSSLYAFKPVFRLWPAFEDLYPPDVQAGDHYYRINDYPRIFEDSGFVLHSLRQRRYTVFVAARNG
jgi:SAM-dependent methyltransferase